MGRGAFHHEVWKRWVKNIHIHRIKEKSIISDGCICPLNFPIQFLYFMHLKFVFLVPL